MAARSTARITPSGQLPGEIDQPAEAHWLEHAVGLAEANVTAGGGPFGAIVVREDRVLGQSGNRVTENNDPTAHAEVMAIRAACRALSDFRLAGALLFSSCEPCPMCLTAALWSRVDRVVYAADRHDAAHAGFDDVAFHETLSWPRADWHVPVVQVRLTSALRPFEAWAIAPHRVDY